MAVPARCLCSWAAPRGLQFWAGGASISWRLLIPLELGLGSAFPKLNSSSVPLACVFGVGKQKPRAELLMMGSLG